MKQFVVGAAAAAACALASSANAAYTTVDLSPYVNLGFTNSWFINGSEFSSIIGKTTGNQGSSVPFNVANVADTSDQGGDNNFWFGLWGGAGNQLFGSPLTVTIPITGGSSALSVYTLTDNTFGSAGTTEFSVTFTGAGGTITDYYIGASNTKDYNLNCFTTGCDSTPYARYWFIDGSGIYPGDGQWLQQTAFGLPSGFGLTSITFTQISSGDGAIVAGVTLSTVAVPEASTWAMMLAGFTALGFAAYRGRNSVSAIA